MFPFGLVKKLRYLPGERMWQTRFLAPADMRDGTYDVRLIMKDREGRAYRESKSFVIASKPPVLRVTADKATARPGETLELRARASASTRTIIARPLRRIAGQPALGRASRREHGHADGARGPARGPLRDPRDS